MKREDPAKCAKACRTQPCWGKGRGFRRPPLSRFKTELCVNYFSPPPHLLLLSVNLPLILGSLYFVSQGQPAPGPFNDEEDCMVPSTPTLYVPKRTDGFAEAIR